MSFWRISFQGRLIAVKKIWEAPRTVVQGFEPNEYVAACVTGTIQCAIPGRSEYICDGSSPIRNFNYDMSWGGKLFMEKGLITAFAEMQLRLRLTDPQAADMK